MMKKLSRVKLINWHLFQNETIEIKGNLLISGDNGSGKSTLVDAIHYVLSGGLAQRKFNMASRNGLSGTRRTVETYMRARIGAVGREFLRPEGDIITHLALEFEDGEEKMTLGCVLQITGGVLLPAKFYELRAPFQDSLFFEIQEDGTKSVRAFEGLRKTATALAFPFIPLEASSLGASYAQVRRSLELPDEYETLLSSAIAFDPNADLLEFTNNFLLQKRNVSLDEVKEAAKAYQDIATLLHHEEEKAKALLPLLALSEERDSFLKDEDALELLSLRLGVEEGEKRRRRAEEDLQALRERERKADQRRLEINQALQEIRQERSALEHRDEEAQIARLKGDISLLDAKIAALSADDVSFDTSLSEMDERADELGFKSSLHTLGKKREGDSFRKAVESYEGNLALVRSSLRGEIDRIAQTRSGLLDELRLLAPRIQILESHEKDFPAGVSKLYRLLKERFQLDSEFALNPLCDCLELVDEDWGEAIETLLGNRRFDCFLPQKFYGEAQKVLAQNPDLRLEGSSGIVDTGTLEGSPFKVDGSLADKIRCAVDASGGDELPLVRDYVDFLLGDIKAVEEPAGRGEFKWITKDGLYYDGASVRYLIREKDFTPYLGKEAIARQLKEMKERYRDLSERIRELDEEKAPLEEKLSRSLGLDPMSLRSLPRHWAEEEDALRKKAELEDRVRALEESMAAEDLTVFNTALEALDERERGLKAELEALFAERDAIAEERGRHNLALEQATNDYQEGKKGYDLFLMDHSDPLLLELAEHKLQEYGKNPYPRIQAAREENHRALLESERKIVRIMGGYNDKFQQNDVEPVLENLPLYIDRYQKIVKDSLVTARSRAEQASITAAENFKTGFLVGLRSNIEQASLQIEKLNRTLRKHPFGSARSIYRFLVKPTGDPELRKIYDIAVNTSEDYYQGDLLSSLLSGENRSTMDYLFRILASENPAESSAETIERFCDYRNYLSYDIVETTPDGQEKRYSDNVRARSGGETQTPFYVLIAASFDSAFELKKRGGSSPCEIVMLDEAFNNMDSDRIEDMMEFYRSLDIQLLVSVPTSRFSYLADHIDSTLVLVSRNERLTCYQGERIRKAEGEETAAE